MTFDYYAEDQEFLKEDEEGVVNKDGRNSIANIDAYFNTFKGAN